MSKAVRFRDFFIRSYLPLEDLTNLLEEKRKTINRYALIVHDKDDSEVHTHLFIRFKERRSLNAVLEEFPSVDSAGVKQSTHVEVCKNEIKSVRYLMHLDNPEKFQYNESEVLTFNLDLQSYIDNESDNQDMFTVALMEMLDGVPLKELARRYGRDFIIHYRQLKELARDIEQEERCRCKTALIDLETGEFTSPNAVKEYDFNLMKEFIRKEEN